MDKKIVFQDRKGMAKRHMAEIQESQTIAGVQLVQLKAFSDQRGRFRELFRKEWFPQRDWGQLQSNCSQSSGGVLRGLHYHFKQVDYWVALAGKLRAGLLDLRRSSPTFGAWQTVEMGEENDVGLYIPIGVAHGFAALTPATLLYFVDHYYDGADEYGVLWNDPAVGLAWGVDDPILSERDKNNPLMAEIDPALMPA